MMPWLAAGMSGFEDRPEMPERPEWGRKAEMISGVD
jgi:hypothetical protein